MLVGCGHELVAAPVHLVQPDNVQELAECENYVLDRVDGGQVAN